MMDRMNVHVFAWRVLRVQLSYFEPHMADVSDTCYSTIRLIKKEQNHKAFLLPKET